MNRIRTGQEDQYSLSKHVNMFSKYVNAQSFSLDYNNEFNLSIYVNSLLLMEIFSN